MHLNMSHLITNITSSTNKSEVSQFDFYEAYKIAERDQLLIYKWVAYVVGTLIVLSNVLVVISSGLILKKGKQPKSTYLLLGNVSLADTIVGFSLIFGITVDNSMSSNIRCIFQIGMLACPAMVSIFSVGLIAVDRYIFILHGLYYQRWFNTRRVRFGILCIWIISVTLGFMPATGWTNTELIRTRCYYVALFPGPLILLNSFLSIIPIIVVAVLYFIILVRVLKNANNIKSTVIMDPTNKTTQLRMYRGTVSDKRIAAYSNQSPVKTGTSEIKRSASFNTNYSNENSKTTNRFASIKAKSIDDLVNSDTNRNQIYCDKKKTEANKAEYESEISIYSDKSNYSNRSASIPDVKINRNDIESIVNKRFSTFRKVKEPNKWRATSIVMLTSSSFIITWLPFFIAVIFFVFCEEKLTNPKCMHIRSLLGGPLATLAFFNCILNPLIYAWWHKGFQKSIRTYYRKYVAKICLCANSETSVKV